MNLPSRCARRRTTRAESRETIVIEFTQGAQFDHLTRECLLEKQIKFTLNTVRRLSLRSLLIMYDCVVE